MSERDPRQDPREGDVFLRLGVYRTIKARDGAHVKSYFESPRWRHTEWDRVDPTFRKWAASATVVRRGEG